MFYFSCMVTCSLTVVSITCSSDLSKKHQRVATLFRPFDPPQSRSGVHSGVNGSKGKARNLCALIYATCAFGASDGVEEF